MKVRYKGYEIEGTVEEVKQLIGGELQKRKYTKRKNKYVYEPKVIPAKRKRVMDEEHKEAIRKGMKKHWRNQSKSREHKEKIKKGIKKYLRDRQ